MLSDRRRSLLTGTLLAVAFGAVAATAEPWDPAEATPPEPSDAERAPIELAGSVASSTGPGCPGLLTDGSVALRRRTRLRLALRGDAADDYVLARTVRAIRTLREREGGDR
jgi:hypothetical protein